MSDKSPTTEEKSRPRVSCGTLFFGFVLGLLLLFLLGLAALAIAVSATGLVEVPVLSRLFKPPALEEDFSYQKVSEKELEKKLATLEESAGPVSISLTDDEFNSILAGQFAQAQETGTVKDILVKFGPGVIKVAGSLSQNETPFYLEIYLEKTASSFELSIRRARLGALPLPGNLITWIAGNFLGLEVPPFGTPSPDNIPAKEVVVGDGTITIKGLDLSGFFGSEEGSSPPAKR